MGFRELLSSYPPANHEPAECVNRFEFEIGARENFIRMENAKVSNESVINFPIFSASSSRGGIKNFLSPRVVFFSRNYK